MLQFVCFVSLLGIKNSGCVFNKFFYYYYYFVQFEIQKLRIYCDPEQNNRETACEIPGVVSIKVCLALRLFFSPKSTEITSSHLLLTLFNCICYCSEMNRTISSSVNSTPYTAWHKMLFIYSVQSIIVLCRESVNSAYSA